MSRFNQRSPGTKTENLAGGVAYSQTPELELVSIMLTSFVQDQFYRSADDTVVKLKSLIAQCDKKFVAQAAVYARQTFGMRSISHVAAAELAKHIGGQPWGKKFYEAVVARPDDMTEIASYYLTNCAEVSTKTKKRGKKTLTGAMKNGLASAFNKFNTYTLAKYRAQDKDFKLVDLVNLVRPKATEKNAEAITALIKGELKSVGTWETQLTQAGQKAENEEQKEEFKKDVWTKLITERTLPIFALLRNLRNILEQAPEALDAALETLTTPEILAKSKIFPFQFVKAYDEIQKTAHGENSRKVLVALNKAIDISTGNVPQFEGKTLVVLDVSQSMTQIPHNSKSTTPPAKIGSLLAAVLAKRNNADLMTFDGDARLISYNPMDSTVTIANGMKFIGGSTDFRAIFVRAERAYDRIIILSDMQGWVGGGAPNGPFNMYKERTGANPFIYSFDLSGYGTMQFPESKVFAVAGFSEKIFDIAQMLEADKNAMINEIKKTEF